MTAPSQNMSTRHLWLHQTRLPVVDAHQPAQTMQPNVHGLIIEHV